MSLSISPDISAEEPLRCDKMQHVLERTLYPLVANANSRLHRVTFNTTRMIYSYSQQGNMATVQVLFLKQLFIQEFANRTFFFITDLFMCAVWYVLGDFMTILASSPHIHFSQM